MSLLVHELLIGTGGGGGSGTSSLKTPSNPVPIANVTVTHSNSTVQVAHLQQSRVVTITTNQSRLSTPDKNSRLADALAGNPMNDQQRHIRSQVISNRSPSPYVQKKFPVVASPERPLRTVSSNRCHSYNLPFVLQDHNYGAPPLTFISSSQTLSPSKVSPPIPYSYKVQQLFASHAASSSLSPKICLPPSPTKAQTQLRKVSPEQSVLTINNVGTVQISTPSATTATPQTSSPSPPPAASHLLSSMPLHRQQFMPHPQSSIYSPAEPSIPTSETGPNPPAAPAVAPPPPQSSQDTDEESRLSDRSSSVGPSGEETETAPEGEEENVQADDSITRCICNFTHDDGYMIQCDRCFVWQHVDCMEIDRNNIPDEYLCEACKPRKTDKSKARALQIRRRQEIRAHLSRVSSSDSEDNTTSRNKNSSNKSQDRKVLKKKKPRASKENKNNKTSNKNSILSCSNNLKSTLSSDEKEVKAPAKTRRRQSSLSVSNSTLGDDTGSSCITIEQLRSWIEDYEVAVTNHYSPELRAKVHATKINGISPEFRESTQAAMLGHRCRFAPSYDAGPDSLEGKILVAATLLHKGTAIIEYQGKYTLKSQWSSVQIPSTLPYLPFVLQYKMQTEDLSVCVDARTYGNDARFARRSANYNAEIRHVVERGSVHLYIVACKEIEEEDEILLPLETSICHNQSAVKTIITAQSNFSNKSEGNENISEDLSNSQIRKNGLLQTCKKNVRKPLLTLALPQSLNRTSRRATSSDGLSCDEMGSPTRIMSPTKQRRASGCNELPPAGVRSPVKAMLKSPSKSPSKSQNEDSSSGESPQQGDKETEHQKMTREERKIAAYMKAFERMEKLAQRRKENEKKKKSGGEEDDDERGIEEKVHTRIRKTSKSSPTKSIPDYMEDDVTGSSSEGEKTKSSDGQILTYGSPPSSTSGFRFPKTKKALMNEWLNETIDPVLHSPSSGGESVTGVPPCYMRSPSAPVKKGGCALTAVSVPVSVEMAGRSAKKRWLRQAIIDETEPQGIILNICSSPNSRPDSPSGVVDYITPLKKRRLARESMSSEQSNTPPTTPMHPGLEEKYNEEMEMDQDLYENMDLDQERRISKTDSAESMSTNIKKEPKDESDTEEKSDVNDRLTINISQIIELKMEIKSELKEEEKPKSQIIKSENDETKTKEEKFKNKLVKRESMDESKKKKIKPEPKEVKSKIVKKNASIFKNQVKPKKSKVVSKKKITKFKNGFETRSQKTSKKTFKSEKKKKFTNLDKNQNMQMTKDMPKVKRKRRRESTDQEIVKQKEPRISLSSPKEKATVPNKKPVILIENTTVPNKEIMVPKEIMIPKQKPIEEESSKGKISVEVEKPFADTLEKTFPDKLEKDCVREEKMNSSNMEEKRSDVSMKEKDSKNTMEENKCWSAAKEKDSQSTVNEQIIEGSVQEKNIDSTMQENQCGITVKGNNSDSTHSTLNEKTSGSSKQERKSESTVTPTHNSDVETSPVASIDNKVLGPQTPEGTPPETPTKNEEYPKLKPELGTPIRNAKLSDLKPAVLNFDSHTTPTPPKSILGCEATDSFQAVQTESPLKWHSFPTKLEADEISSEQPESSILLEKRESCPTPIAAPVKPVAVKRKLSILEYRKRKSLSCEREAREDKAGEANPKGRCSSTEVPIVEELEPYPQLLSMQEEARKGDTGMTQKSDALKLQLAESEKKPPLNRYSTTLSGAPNIDKGKVESSSTEGVSCVKESKEIKWNAAPTLLEQQRENLTARLRREFGLRLPDEGTPKLKIGTDKHKEPLPNPAMPHLLNRLPNLPSSGQLPSQSKMSASSVGGLLSSLRNQHPPAPLSISVPYQDAKLPPISLEADLEREAASSTFSPFLVTQSKNVPL